MPCVTKTLGTPAARAAALRAANPARVARTHSFAPVAAISDIILCGDDDDAGRKYAERAAKAVNARAVFPGGGVNDFNDLHQARGLDAVRTAVLGESAAAMAEDEEDWRAELIIKHKDDGSQQIPCRVHNLILILKHAPEFKGRIRHNTFADRVAIDGDDISDAEAIKIKAALEKSWITERVPTSDVHDALQVVAAAHPFHPVRDYLDALRWDGTERIAHFFEDYCGCPRDAYHMAVARSLFVSAVARIYKPGCKVDTMVILESEQGLGKSKLWLTLFGEWCAELTASLSDKDFYASLRGVWCMDFAELDAFSRSEATQIKRILTSQSDNYRQHYGRSSKSHPRQCVFVGGTNRDDWHKDETGGRRFLPVKIGQTIDVDAVAASRDQLWAEAKVYFERGDTWWDIPDAEAHQDEIYAQDTWEEVIDRWLTARLHDLRHPNEPFAYLLGTIMSEALRIEPGKQTRSDQTRAGSAMRRLGWRVKQETLRGGGRSRVYRPTEKWIKEREKPGT